MISPGILLVSVLVGQVTPQFLPLHYVIHTTTPQKTFSKVSCPPGYSYQTDNFHSYLVNVNDPGVKYIPKTQTRGICAGHCDVTPNCCGFEYSESHHDCILETNYCGAHQPLHGDYHVCVRKGKASGDGPKKFIQG